MILLDAWNVLVLLSVLSVIPDIMLILRPSVICVKVCCMAVVGAVLAYLVCNVSQHIIYTRLITHALTANYLCQDVPIASKTHHANLATMATI